MSVCYLNWFGFWHWTLILAMPILVAVIAKNTAKVTVTETWPDFIVNDVSQRKFL